MLPIKLLLLVMVANSAPVLAYDLLRTRFSRPVDFGVRFFDGAPLFGESKTWRGLWCAILATPLAAEIIGLRWETGLIVAVAAMGGDLTSSFIKRRLRRPASSMALGLDQIPESLFPLLAVRADYALDLGTITLLVVTFFAVELVLSRLFFQLGLRKRPY